MRLSTSMDQAASGAVGTRAAAVVTLVFGCALVFVVGFAHATTLHNAGHDTRHAMAFPCH